MIPVPRPNLMRTLQQWILHFDILCTAAMHFSGLLEQTAGYLHTWQLLPDAPLEQVSRHRWWFRWEAGWGGTIQGWVGKDLSGNCTCWDPFCLFPPWKWENAPEQPNTMWLPVQQYQHGFCCILWGNLGYWGLLKAGVIPALLTGHWGMSGKDSACSLPPPLANQVNCGVMNHISQGHLFATTDHTGQVILPDGHSGCQLG